MESAAQIASKVRTGRLRARDVVIEALERAEESQEQLNSFTLIDNEGALERAARVDKLVADGRDPGPLAGVPIGLKDLIDQSGLPNTKGGSFTVENSKRSATVVERLGDAGGVIIGRTNLHEFAFGFTSENHWFGPVRNPWDTDTSAGGSSGGSGAAVASGVTPIAVGTDTGGSVRVPAALCGVYGIKVTHGRIPLTGVYPLVPSLDTVGPLARNVEDLALSYLAMAGDDPTDPWSQPVPLDRPLDGANLSGLRFGVVKQWSANKQSSQVSGAISQFIDSLTSHGVDVVEVDENGLWENESAARAYGPEVIAIHGDRLTDNPQGYSPQTGTRIRDAAVGDASDLMAAMKWRSEAGAILKRLSNIGIDVLIAPTVGAMRKVIGDDDIDVDGEKIFHRRLLASFTAPINQIGAPSIAAPIAPQRADALGESGDGESGVRGPGVSVQLVGPHWSESKLLSIASSLENAGLIGVSPPPIIFDS